ncbi:Beta-glucuronidase [Blattella germanica]|nr:Beta-glucuronidase [Blattella germanica]
MRLKYCLPFIWPTVLLMAAQESSARISVGGILYPQESESRDVRTLDGIWNFRLSPQSDHLTGFRERWFQKDLSQTGETIPMPVPASYNDVTQEKKIRDHLGLVWYDRTFFVPDAWRQNIWVNGHLIMSHEIGHLPFEADITAVVKFGTKNRVTVAVDNTLHQSSIPQGYFQELQTENGSKVVQSYTFDFFNYAGIHRSYNVTYGGRLRASSQGPACYVDLLDRDGNYVIRDAGSGRLQGELEVPVKLSAQQWGIEDIYRLPVGIRTVEWNNTTILINGRPIYMRGFGRHEDSDWTGANSYRTSHYPYAEEIMDFADKQGIMIIDECPSVDTDNFSPALLEKHKDSLSELIRRDKNRPSVIFWSLANEARTQAAGADNYFRAVADHVRQLDSTRPITMALAQSSSKDKTGQYLDMIGFNRYNSWYVQAGRTEIITNNVVAEATAWHQKYNKPIMMMEYGADTLPGLHLIFLYFLRFPFYFLSTTRVGGNKKGIFTRSRQPKDSAHFIRRRYWALAEELDNVISPKDIDHYVSRKLH